MRPAGGTYRSLEDLQHEAKEIVTPYWKAVSYLSMWLLLGGFLLLPSTFDSTPQLRFSSGVIIVLIVAFLTAGYSLTILLYFAVPSPLFRLEALLVPSASASFFSLCAAAWTLVSSPRFDPSMPGCPITLGLTFASVIVYGGFGLWTSHKIKAISRRKPYAAVTNWRDSASANYNPYVSSSYPLTAPSEHASAYYSNPHDYAHPGQLYAQPSLDYSAPQTQPPPQSQAPAAPVPHIATEEELVTQQMASLLAKPVPGPTPDATQQTFRLEWPAAEDEETTPLNRSQSQQVGNGAKSLFPDEDNKHMRSRSGSEVAIPPIRIGRTASPDERGRQGTRTAEEQANRARSRDERRQEIERNSIA